MALERILGRSLSGGLRAAGRWAGWRALVSVMLLLGAGSGRDAAAAPEAPEDVPAFAYEQYCDAQGHFTYDGAALKLVKRPSHLARVYGDSAREDARAKVLVRELEHWFHQAGVIVADTTTRPACLPLPEMTPKCQPNWQFLTEFLGDTPEASRLRQVVANAYEARTRERRLQNNVIVAGVNLLLAGGMAKGLMNQAATAEARGQALAAEAKATQVEARTAGQGGIAAGKGPALPDEYWINREAPTQVQPGTRRLTDQKPSGRSQGEVYERTTHYDEYGRQVGQTHKTAHGEPAVHPNPHHHTRNPKAGEVSGPLPGVHPNY